MTKELIPIWNTLCKDFQLTQKNLQNKQTKKAQIISLLQLGSSRTNKRLQAQQTLPSPCIAMKQCRKALLTPSVPTAWLHNWRHGAMTQACLQTPAECVYTEPRGRDTLPLCRTKSLATKENKYVQHPPSGQEPPISTWKRNWPRRFLRRHNLFFKGPFKFHNCSFICCNTDTNSSRCQLGSVSDMQDLFSRCWAAAIDVLHEDQEKAFGIPFT